MSYLTMSYDDVCERLQALDPKKWDIQVECDPSNTQNLGYAENAYELVNADANTIVFPQFSEKPVNVESDVLSMIFVVTAKNENVTVTYQLLVKKVVATQTYYAFPDAELESDCYEIAIDDHVLCDPDNREKPYLSSEFDEILPEAIFNVTKVLERYLEQQAQQVKTLTSDACPKFKYEGQRIWVYERCDETPENEIWCEFIKTSETETGLMFVQTQQLTIKIDDDDIVVSSRDGVRSSFTVGFKFDRDETRYDATDCTASLSDLGFPMNETDKFNGNAPLIDSVNISDDAIRSYSNYAEIIRANLPETCQLPCNCDDEINDYLSFALN